MQGITPLGTALHRTPSSLGRDTCPARGTQQSSAAATTGVPWVPTAPRCRTRATGLSHHSSSRKDLAVPSVSSSPVSRLTVQGSLSQPRRPRVYTRVMSAHPRPTHLSAPGQRGSGRGTAQGTPQDGGAGLALEEAATPTPCCHLCHVRPWSLLPYPDLCQVQPKGLHTRALSGRV